MSATIVDFETELAKRLPEFRLGEEGQRVRLKADCSLTSGAARTLAAQLLVLADRLPKGAR